MFEDIQAPTPAEQSKGDLNSRFETERVDFQSLYLAKIAPSVALTTLIEAAWGAGFFDGEGHAGAPNLNDAVGSSPRMTMEIAQGYGDQGLANLVRFQTAVGGVGTISGPLRNGEAGLPFHRWRANSEEHIAVVVDTILPFVGPAKYEQIRTTVMVAPIYRHVRLSGAAEATSSKDRRILSVDTQAVPKRGRYYD